MRNTKKRWILAALTMTLAFGMIGCGKGEPAVPEEEYESLVIQMYGSLDESYVPFLNALAEQFPEVDLRYEYQWDNAGVNETKRRILHGDGPDLAVVSGAALHSLTESDLLLDLTNAEFSTRYHVSTMTELNDQGRVMGLPLPNDLRCLVCNRAILEENGVTEVPRTVSELMAICQTLSERGQGAIIADEQLYQMLLRTTYLCKPTGYNWLQSYNNGETAMEGSPAADAWKSFEALAAVSGCSQEDVTALAARRTTLMLQGQYAFRGVTLSNLKYMQELNPELDLIALPLLGETEEDQWVFYAEQRNMRYFVANGTLAQPENAEKQKIVLRMLDWISTGEAQQILASCGYSAISYVSNVELDQGSIMEYLTPVIERGHLTSSETLERGVGNVVSDCAAEIVGGSMTHEEAVRACDVQNIEYSDTPLKEKNGLDEVIGAATDPIYWRKPAAVTVGSPMTQLAAVAMAEAFPETDFAFAMAKNTAATLYPGEITMEDALTCANGEGDRELMLVEATGAQIKALINAGIGSPVEATFVLPYGVLGKGRLLHPAGLTYRADINRYEKITEITLANGSELDMEKSYTIIVSGLLVDDVVEPNLKGCQMTSTGKYLRDVLVEYIRARKEISPPEVGFEITGITPIYTLP